MLYFLHRLIDSSTLCFKCCHSVATLLEVVAYRLLRLSFTYNALSLLDESLNVGNAPFKLIPREFLNSCEVGLTPSEPFSALVNARFPVRLYNLLVGEIHRKDPVLPQVTMLLEVVSLDLALRSEVSHSFLNFFNHQFLLSGLDIFKLIFNLSFNINPFPEFEKVICTASKAIDYLESVNRSDSLNAWGVVRPHEECHHDEVLSLKTQLLGYFSQRNYLTRVFL